MCGIYGYIGKGATREALSGIKRLEYRGYDSAGLAFMDGQIENQEGIFKDNIGKKGDITFIKSEGQISRLEEIIDKVVPRAPLAIGHTRWATHGKPSTLNCHPHLSSDGKWAIVHNGIIENYKELKMLVKGEKFASETDTEVVVKLLQQFYDGNVLGTIKYVCSLLEGSFAFAIITSHDKESLFVAKKGSPVVACCGDGFGLVCSDLNSITSVKEAYLLEDNQFAVVTKGGVRLYDEELCEIKLKNLALCEREKREALGKYKHFMLKEIDEIPSAIERTIERYNNFESFRQVLPLGLVRKLKKVLIVGCGTAFHAGLIGRWLFEKIGIKTEVEIASELRYASFNYSKDTLAIFVSQSGETADTIGALELCKQKGLVTLAMTNVRNSSICFAADRVIYTCAGAEIGVASTKAYNCQVALFYMLAAYFKEVFSQKNGVVTDEAIKLTMVAEQIRANRNKVLCQNIAKEISKSNSIYMIGRGIDYAIAREASLKLKEISYIHCEACPAGELKHGTISLIDKDKFVFAFSTQSELKEKTQGNISEVSSREGKVILLSPFEEGKKGVHRFIKLPSLEEHFMPLYVIGYMQLIAYYTSLELGNNPDKPRSLAKSVTVE